MKASERETQGAAHALLLSCRAPLKSAVGDSVPTDFGHGMSAQWLVQKPHVHRGAFCGPNLPFKTLVCHRIP